MFSYGQKTYPKTDKKPMFSGMLGKPCSGEMVPGEDSHTHLQKLEFANIFNV